MQAETLRVVLDPGMELAIDALDIGRVPPDSIFISAYRPIRNVLMKSLGAFASIPASSESI
jgi:hypothetical protein